MTLSSVLKRAFITCFFLSVLFTGKPQSTLPFYASVNTYLNNYVQPAPNVASLGKFANYPVSYYTGVPQIAIPLYKLTDGASEMSISLAYHASGIRVGELASWVGLGWALNAGGMITRAVRGAPDEGSGKNWGGLGPGPTGYYRDYGLSTLPALPTLTNYDKALNSYPPTAIMAGYMDTEPDLFTFNFCGKTGNFVFDENRTVRTFENGNLKINPVYSGGTFVSWSVIDESGVEYFFGENNTYEETLPSSFLNSSEVDSRSYYPSSWFLTRVVYPNTKDTIYLNYTPEKYLYRDLPPESVTYDDDNLNQACSYVVPTQDVLQTTILGQRLTNIKSRNYNIVFAAHNVRKDLYSYSAPYPYSLDSVNIYTSQGQCLKRWLLGYDYFVSPASATTSAVAGILSRVVDSSDMRRLKLKTVTEYSGDGSIAKPGFSLGYSETLPLPRRLSYDQDHWGYSNNYHGNVNSYFMGSITSSLCNNIPTVGANRAPKWPDMQACTLTNIVDPLGVSTNFTYEAHGTGIGGLRLKQVSTTDSVTGITGVKNITYANQMLYQTPVYMIIPYNEYYLSYAIWDIMSLTTAYLGYNPPSSSVLVNSIIKQSQSIVPLQDYQGNHVGYGSVTESIGSRGEGGKKVYTFQTYGKGNEDSHLSMYNYTSPQSFLTKSGYTQTGLAGNGLFNQISPDSLLYHTGYQNGNLTYPLAPKQFMFGRGQLAQTDTYDSAGVLLSSTANTYSESYNENYNIRGLRVLRTVNLHVASLIDAFTFYKFHTGISHLKSSTTTEYKDGKTMSTTTTFSYESPYHVQKTGETTTNSTGDTIIKKTYYSFDYTNGAFGDSTIAKMKARNMLVPVATRVWKNNTLISGTVTKFKDFATSSTDTFVNPVKIYSFETSIPFTPTQAGEAIAYTGQMTSLLPNSNFIEKADFNVNGTTGRIIEQKLVNDKNQALIWDNQLNLPLAKIDNANFSDVAYSSFESSETGNWTISPGAVVSDTTAPTGSHAYSLNSGSMSKSGLTGSQSYVISYWTKSGASVSITGGTISGSVTGRTLNGYTYHESRITSATSLSLSGTGYVDEVRLYPAAAQMNTYTYDPLLRLVATCSVNSTISYYDYDSMNRVVDIKDQFGNILKAYEYNYGRLSR